MEVKRVKKEMNLKSYFKFFVSIPLNVRRKYQVLMGFKLFKDQAKLVPILSDTEINLVSDSTTSPHEVFAHYDAFYFWIGRDIWQKSKLYILDIGGKKIMNAYLSANNFVTAVNLVSPVDTISNVNYIVADVTKKLPFTDSYFDLFISPVSLNLIGLGRYGDNIDAKAIPELIQELSRVMKDDSVMYISMILGRERIQFNHHYVFCFETIEKLFHGWKIIDYLVDLQNIDLNYVGSRFTRDLDSIMEFLSENENVIFLKLVRKDK